MKSLESSTISFYKLPKNLRVRSPQSQSWWGWEPELKCCPGSRWLSSSPTWSVLSTSKGMQYRTMRWEVPLLYTFSIIQHWVLWLVSSATMATFWWLVWRRRALNVSSRTVICYLNALKQVDRFSGSMVRVSCIHRWLCFWDPPF